jgi:hypothetical protein
MNSTRSIKSSAEQSSNSSLFDLIERLNIRNDLNRSGRLGYVMFDLTLNIEP